MKKAKKKKKGSKLGKSLIKSLKQVLNSNYEIERLEFMVKLNEKAIKRNGDQDGHLSDQIKRLKEGIFSAK